MTIDQMFMDALNNGMLPRKYESCEMTYTDWRRIIDEPRALLVKVFQKEVILDNERVIKKCITAFHRKYRKLNKQDVTVVCKPEERNSFLKSTKRKLDKA